MINDYIMRIIEQFVQALASIIRARKSGNQKEALELIQKAGRFYLDTDISPLLALQPDQLLEKFKKDNELDAERCLICADLLHEVALISDSQNNDVASLRLKVLCLHLYVNALLKEKHFQTAEYLKKIASLIEDTKEKPLPAEVQGSLQMFKKFL